MKYILFLVLIVALIFTILYYDKKEAMLKHQLLATQNYNKNLKEQLKKYGKISDDIEIKFSIPSVTLGIIKEYSNVLLCPLDSSIIVCKQPIKMEVEIIDKAEISNTSWYYVSLPIDSNINCRGWVKEENFITPFSVKQKCIEG